MILVIDNYDSFVHNLARYFEREGKECRIVRNDAITIEEAAALQPEAIVISPGPCSPREAGISVELIKQLGPSTPILGICLGHQCIGEAYGAAIARSDPAHGWADVIIHNGDPIFDGVPPAFMAGRYHALAVKPSKNLLTIAQTGNETIMALRHPQHPVYGLQFHPESILTRDGAQMICNFIRIAARWQERKAAA